MGRGGSGNTSRNRAGKRLARDGLPVWLVSTGHGGNGGHAPSVVEELSVHFETKSADATNISV